MTRHGGESPMDGVSDPRGICWCGRTGAGGLTFKMVCLQSCQLGLAAGWESSWG